ncbi:MAG: DUF3365 domain-containing protein [Pirellulales bacterium]
MNWRLLQNRGGKRRAPTQVVGGLILASVAIGGYFADCNLRAEEPTTQSSAKADSADKSAGDAAVARTRKQVLMLDDLYKTAVVLITDKYVQKETDLSAGSAAQALFDAMRKKGHHDIRLLDATGSPYDDENSPRDDFEKEAIRRLKMGEATVERVEKREGGRVLRMATPIPVVLDKCVLCHEAYKSAKKGEAIGALSYTLRVE